MKKIILTVLALLVVGFGILAIVATRDGSLVTPQGEGTIATASGEFEAFPLPLYAADMVGTDYKSFLVEVEPGIKMHVLEVGEGYPVYMQHGNPTSGFLYRKVAGALPRDRFRVIMPTLVGLGFSSKVPASEHTLENHLRWTAKLIETLDLEQVIYVGQDWGGPTGMGALARNPGVLQGAVVMNTGFNAPTEEGDISSAHAAVKTPVVGEFMLEIFGSIFDRLPGAQGDPASMPEDVLALYGRPLKDDGNIKAPLAMMRMVSDGPDHPSAEQMLEIEAYAKTLDVPVRIVWGMADPILGDKLDAMKANFPNAAVTETKAGHFLQEEVPEVIAAEVLEVYAEIEGASADQAASTP
jgi:haloalkane dehalogenase